VGRASDRGYQWLAFWGGFLLNQCLSLQVPTGQLDQSFAVWLGTIVVTAAAALLTAQATWQKACARL
jgi:hypothetical protein